MATSETYLFAPRFHSSGQYGPFSGRIHPARSPLLVARRRALLQITLEEDCPCPAVNQAVDPIEDLELAVRVLLKQAQVISVQLQFVEAAPKQDRHKGKAGKGNRHRYGEKQLEAGHD